MKFIQYNARLSLFMKPVSVHVDLLNTGSDKVQQKKTAIIAVFFACLVGILATIGAAASYRAASHGTSVFAEMRNLPVIAEFTHFATGEDNLGGNSAYAKTADDRINILFLGVGGDGHDGAQLSDTIILASYDTKSEKFAMLSIPRDLAYPIGNSQFRKINNLNAIYEAKYPGEGAKKTAEAISELLVIRIDHVIKIDFDGFATFIDALGGVDVDVEKSFTDSSYPAPGHLWKTVRFEAGQTHMDGNTALEFVRSRHGNNGEGSDFARSRRQQLVIQAVRDKLLSMGTLANPKKISELYNVISGNIQTDLSAWDMISLVPYVTKLDDGNITVRVLTDASDGELSPANVGGEYMLFPRKPDWSEIRTIAANPFVSKEDEKKLLMPASPIALEIKNGTNYEGYAYQVTQKLKSLGYNVPSFGNASHKGYERTVLYDLTGGKEPEELVRLKKILDADVSSATPQELTDSDERAILTDDMAQERIKASSTQFLIILGESSLGLIQPYYEPSQN
ncbi:LCP family protein [Patescibacteria group bacterium]|nr:LCP family protein [Patescibacteria group bacterium]